MVAVTSVRRGFTLMELVLALVLVGLLLGGIWTLVDLAGRQYRTGKASSSAQKSAFQLHTSLRADIERAGEGLLAAPNLSGLQVVTGGAEGAERDTLTVLRATGEAPYRNSVYWCGGDATGCLLLLGDASSLDAGDLLVVGAPQLGARLVQVDSVAPSYQAQCGADCRQETLTCSDANAELITAPVVTGSTMHYPDGSTTTQTAPCNQTFYPDGRRCEESAESQAVGYGTSETCAIPATSAQVYTEVHFTDRTALLSYPSTSLQVLQSGVGGVPLVVSQPVHLVRYWLQDGVRPQLVQQAGLNANGSFPAPAPVATDVQRFRLETLHEDAGEYVRGVNVAPDDLDPVATNPNFRRTTEPAESGYVRGMEFTRSYQTIGAVRVTLTVRSHEAASVSDGRDVVTTVATTKLLDGGALIP